MPTTSTHQSPALPLALPSGARPAGPPHRMVVALPEGARPHVQQYAIAALAALLHRYTGETDVLIDLPAPAGRTVEVGVTGDTTAGELLAAAAVAAIAPPAPATQGEDPPGPQVPETGPSDRDRPVHAAVAADAGGARAHPLTVRDVPDGLELVMPATGFDRAAAAQYARHLERIVAALAADPSVAVRDLPLLTEEETRLALTEWNRTDEPVPPAFFHELVAEHARRTPDAVAVALPDARVTYRELDEAANRLARHLTRLGIAPRSRIGVCFHRGADSLVAQLACFKLASAAILLDPDFPGDRIRFMIEDSSAAAVLTVAEHGPKLAGSCPVVNLDTADWRAEEATEVHEPVGADDIIHIGYTSGSTGSPKAVLARFGAARNLIHSMRKLCVMSAATQGTWLAAPGYGMIQVECFPVLAAGATVNIPEISVVASPERLREWFLERRITSTLLMKPMAERLWTLDWPADTPLRDIRVCGERIQSWPPAGLPFRLINLYGSTEATTAAGCDITELGASLGEEGRSRRLPPIGRPICNVKIYVLDESLKPVPPGVVGELCITGDGLSTGYLNRPELTAERWVPNPVQAHRERHPVLYRTGDMARRWPDGSIEIVGRRDNQLKVRGNTVHLGEIEVVLAAQPGIRQVAVVARTDAHGDVQLTAYLEPEAGTTPAVRELRRTLRQRLPAFMVPSAYVVGEFPMSRNGKIDRAALPEPPRSRPDVGTAYQEPRDEIERALCGIWSDMLELEGIGVLDDFFELGGDSLRAARLAERVRSVFDIDIELGDLFHEASIAKMARLLRDQELTRGQEPTPAGDQVGRGPAMAAAGNPATP